MKTEKITTNYATGIELAIAACGSEWRLASKCNVTQQTVNYWRKKGKVPLKHIHKVERAEKFRNHENSQILQMP